MWPVSAGRAAWPSLTTYRRHQRFFQHVRLAQDWAAPMIAGLAGGAAQRTLVSDRTNWKIGQTEVNGLVLAVRTRHSQVPLMWTVLGRGGNAGAPERIALIGRTIALSGKDTIRMLLADREFIGADCLNHLVENDIPFTIRMIGSHLATLCDGRRCYLGTRLTRPGKGRRITATLTGMTTPLHFAATVPRGGEAVIVATNRLHHNPLASWRKRWAIESLFGNTRTRGLNFEDTRLTDPAKLHLLTAIVALAVAWAVRAARTLLGQTAPERKAHGHLAKSCFRTGPDHIRHRLRADLENAIEAWSNLKSNRKIKRVV